MEQPLGTQLVYAVMQLLFLGGFTVEPNDYGGPAESEIGEFFNYFSVSDSFFTSIKWLVIIFATTTSVPPAAVLLRRCSLM
jgi:hypothetical protein